MPLRCAWAGTDPLLVRYHDTEWGVPLHDDRRLFEEMQKYPNLKELIWCQEEPMNQGAWYAKHHRLERLIKKGQTLDAVARASSPSPAVGYAAKHALQQKEVVNAALGIKE